ncbi:MAG TPA: carboxypeptidase-like regulatory domain-containing protein, partial [Flavisolibacter sp.]|nr:carboxypeptidase-like regulatory domain-containing protein [Flavisolibacter sp.]
MRFRLLAFCLLFGLLANSQSKFTVNGYVKDSATGETIVGATITILGQAKTVSTNQYGFYSFTLDEGTYTLSVSHVSYFARQMELALIDNRGLDILLPSKAAAMNEVVVFSRRKDANVRNAQMSKIELS